MRTVRLAVCGALVMSLVSSTVLEAQAPLTIGNVTAKPGTSVPGTFEIAARAGDTGTSVPFTIVHGARPGPVLALIAGTHGAEYVPIIALQRLRAAIDPARLSGTLVLVHVANMPSYLARTVYYSPADGKNLNRVFPGNAAGTLSERIAEVLTREVITKATHVVDLHCGDGNESLRPYSYWITTGDPKVAAAGRAMALAFGLDHIVVDNARPTDPAASIYLSNTAITRGTPAITTETGGLGVVDDASIALIERGVAGLMRHLGMRPDGPGPVTAPVWIDSNEVLRASATGIFYAAVTRGQAVKKGTKIGHITDFHGRTIDEVVAPWDGQILYVIGTPPISKGEPVAMVGAIRK